MWAELLAADADIACLSTASAALV